MTRIFVAAALAVCAFSSCVTPGPDAPAPASSAAPLPPAWPRSPALEAQWGKPGGPSLQLDGHQGVHYRDPAKRGNYVVVTYEGTAQPREIRDFNGKRASDGTMSIMGQTVDFYGSGAEDAAITTQPVQLVFPDGTKGWFNFTFAAPQHLSGKHIPAFTW